MSRAWLAPSAVLIEKIAPPGNGSREREIGQVRASDEQHEPRSRPERAINYGRIRTNKHLRPGMHSGDNTAIRRGPSRFEAAVDGLEFGTRFAQAGAISQPAERHIGSGGNSPPVEFRGVVQRQPQIVFLRKFEAFRHHANDGYRRPVEINGRADDVCALAEPVHPQLPGDHGNRRGSGDFIGRPEIPP
jgi:hypothetical protein